MNYKVKNWIKRRLFTSNRGHEIYSLFGNIVRGRRANLTDREYVEKSFYENTGVKLNLDTPKTFRKSHCLLVLSPAAPQSEVRLPHSKSSFTAG